MGIGQFFKKLGSDTKKFFSKGGAADVGLRKIGNTLSKVGGVAKAVAPLAAIVAPEIAAPLMAGGALAGVAGQTAKNIRHGAQKGGNIVEKTQNISNAIKGGIEASKPLAENTGVNFA
jgi:methyl-accepting chemotaxis protein